MCIHIYIYIFTLNLINLKLYAAKDTSSDKWYKLEWMSWFLTVRVVHSSLTQRDPLCAEISSAGLRSSPARFPALGNRQGRVLQRQPVSAALYRHLPTYHVWHGQTSRVTTGDSTAKTGSPACGCTELPPLQHPGTQHEWSHATTPESKMTEMPNLYFPMTYCPVVTINSMRQTRYLLDFLFLIMKFWINDKKLFFINL